MQFREGLTRFASYDFGQMMTSFVGGCTTPELFASLPTYVPHWSTTRGISTSEQRNDKNFRTYAWFSIDDASTNDYLKSWGSHQGTSIHPLPFLSRRILADPVHHSLTTNYCSIPFRHLWGIIDQRSNLASIATAWFACTKVEFLRNECQWDEGVCVNGAVKMKRVYCETTH